LRPIPLSADGAILIEISGRGVAVEPNVCKTVPSGVTID